MEISSPNYTQFPNEILDEWMSLLTGSEFKIISIIVRKTFGWKKEKDKISISQLEMITGLGKTQITKSVKNLENRGFIICIKHKNKPAEYAIKVVQKVNYKSLKVVQKVNESSSESELQKLESSSESEHTKESSIKETNKRKVRRILPQTKEEVINYAKENNLTVDIDFFWKFFTESNWVDSNGKEVWNWKQKLLTWESKQKGKNKLKDNLSVNELYANTAVK